MTITLKKKSKENYSIRSNYKNKIKIPGNKPNQRNKRPRQLKLQGIEDRY